MPMQGLVVAQPGVEPHLAGNVRGMMPTDPRRLNAREIPMTGDARLGLVILAVGDLARARDFYRSAFGWPAEVDMSVYVEFGLPEGMRLGLYARDAFGKNIGEGPSPTPVGAVGAAELYLFPDDLESTADRLVAAGARPLSPARAAGLG